MTPRRRMPAEWEPHEATWIAWPHNPDDWPGKFEPIPWVYAEIVRALHTHERVEILCQDAAVRESARECLNAHGVRPEGYRLHVVPTDRSWLRDSAPTAVLRTGTLLELVQWGFNAWAKYENYAADARVGDSIIGITGAPSTRPSRPDGAGRVILEGGAFDCDGSGLILTTEECLLSDIQQRNPGLHRNDYEQIFDRYLGAPRTIWLGEGCVGDDTHGHVDDVARFSAPGVVLLAVEQDPADDNHLRSLDNLQRLQSAEREGVIKRIVTLPFPRPVVMAGQRLPASYANFYVANGVVLVPTFNDRNDRIALNTIAEAFPTRDIIGVHAVDLVWGLGTLHCLTQPQPRPGRGGNSEDLGAASTGS